jgi:hypothetical protein
MSAAEVLQDMDEGIKASDSPTATTTGAAKAVNTNHVLAAAIRDTASARHHGAVAPAINATSGVTISKPLRRGSARRPG